MPIMKFVKYAAEEDANYSNPDTTKVIVKADVVALYEAIEEFEAFLKACGYHFPGQHLEMVDDPVPLKEED